MSAYDLLGLDGPLMGDDSAGDELLGDELLGALMDGGDLSGDDTMGDEMLGRRVRRALAKRAAGGQRAGVAMGLPNKRPALFTRTPGVNAPAIGRLPLGFGVLALVATDTGGVLTARPQVPWRGSKLILSINGTNADLYAVNFSPTIGNRPVLAGAGTIDARAFPSTGIDNNLIAESAAPGIDVTLTFTVTPVIAAGDTVNITATWIGDATT